MPAEVGIEPWDSDNVLDLRWLGLTVANNGRLAFCLAAVAMAVLPPLAARCDSRSVLSGLVGHRKTELIQRFGFPSDAVTTIDGELLIYDTLDAGQVGGRSWRGSRLGNPGPYSRSYSFRCRTEVVVRGGIVRAFNRSGNDCR